MKAVHIRDVDELVIHRVARLARFHKRSMQAELRVILEEAAVRAQALENDEGDELIPVAADTERGYRREYLVAATRPVEVNGLGMKLSDALKNMFWFRNSGIHTLLTNNPGDFSPFHGIEAMTPEEFS